MYNYKIISGEIPNKDGDKAWWIGDVLKVCDNKYLLEIEYVNSKDSRIKLEITFDDASAKK